TFRYYLYYFFNLITNKMNRCEWLTNDPIYIEYHDKEWGKPTYNDLELFELLILEGFQAGLSWLTVLKKRTAFRKAFDFRNPEKIAAYDDTKIEELLQNKDIIRNRLKIKATITNARVFLDIQKEYGSFSKFLWSFVNHKPIINNRKSIGEIPATTVQSDMMSKTMKKKGFKFCGSTICYALMQSCGMVNDHTKNCFL